MRLLLILILCWSQLLYGAYPIGVKGAGQSTPSYPSVIDFGNTPITTSGSNVKINSSTPKNYITANDGSKIGSWVTFADGSATPVDGIGGSPNSTFAVSTNSSMRGTTNFLWTKNSGASRLGEGFSYPFTIDPSDKGKVLQISLEYLISGTYVDDDLQFWIYDITAGALIQPAPFKLKNSGIIEKFGLEFQTSQNTSYRLIGIHTTADATNAYAIRFTNWSLGAQAKLYGSPITDPIPYTFTGAMTTNTTYTAFGSKRGKYFFGNLKISFSGAPNAVTEDITLPSGIAIDTAYLANNGVSNHNIGYATLTQASTGFSYKLSARLISSTVLRFEPIDASSSWAANNSSMNATTPITLANGDILTYDFEFPIQGWSSSQVMSSDADTRVVIFEGWKQSGSQNIPNGNLLTEILFDSTKIDTHSGFNSSNGRYTVQVPGYYKVTSVTNVQLGATPPVTSVSYIAKNRGLASEDEIGQDYKQGQDLTASSFVNHRNVGIFNCKAGDYLSTVVAYTGGTGGGTVTSGGGYYTHTTIERVAGPSQIAASESVSAFYQGAPPAGTITSSFNTIIFGIKVKDSHNAYSGGSYTAPVSGVYDIGSAMWVVGTYALNTESNVGVYVDGTRVAMSGHISGGVKNQDSFKIDLKAYPLLAGQVVTIKLNSNVTGGSFSSDNTRNWFSIVRTGNY